MKTLILGGIRSGKSRLAVLQARETTLPVVLIATATGGDDEMAARIALHKKSRPKDWTVVEEPVALKTALVSHAAEGRCVVVDCLTLWLNNLLGRSRAADPRQEIQALVRTVATLAGEIIFVSNETGMGVIPDNPLARRFCDLSGELHQELAAVCDRVIYTIAGLPHTLKDRPA